MVTGRLEITDLLWPSDDAGRRLAVVKAEVIATLADRGQRRAAAIVTRKPDSAGVIDPGYLDALGIRVHCELQRLGEELQFGRRVAALAGPVVARLREAGPEPVRIVDLGCGLGYLTRWLAATGALGPGVELIGLDLNAALVSEAASLARREGLDCRFVRGDAFEPGRVIDDGGRTLVISSGLLHHLPESSLADFFAATGKLGVAAYAHWDIAPCLWSTLGAWIFHQARMREPVSRHDGVLSARRAHPARVLQAAAVAGAPDYGPEVLEGGRWHPRAIDVLRPIVGTRPAAGAIPGVAAVPASAATAPSP